MERDINVELNKFEIIPNSLRIFDDMNVFNKITKVNLARLYHHYYLDTYGKVPPNPDPSQFEYLQFLTNTSDFRFLGDGLGSSTSARRNRSSELGQAFCRWFLYEHLNITYFAHMEHVLDKNMHPSFRSFNISRVKSGDTPDYFCAEGVNKVFLAEAKGRYSSISFKNKEFEKWREQFKTINIKDNAGNIKSIKGYIVGTRFVTEEDKDSINTTVYAEDPRTEGELEFGENFEQELRSLIISLHYANIAEKLNQPILASALRQGFSIPEQINFPGIVWEIQFGPFAGRRFVGGYYSKEPVQIYKYNNGKSIGFNSNNPFDLNSPGVTFFGLEEKIFKYLTENVRQRFRLFLDIPEFTYEGPEYFYSGISVLRDGSILSPIEFLKPVDEVY